MLSASVVWHCMRAWDHMELHGTSWRKDTNISLRVMQKYANTERFQVLASLLPYFCPLRVPEGCMWGIIGKPLIRGIWNALGLHAVLPICLRFSGTKAIWPKTALFPVRKQGHFRPNSFHVGTAIFTYW